MSAAVVIDVSSQEKGSTAKDKVVETTSSLKARLLSVKASARKQYHKVKDVSVRFLRRHLFIACLLAVIAYMVVYVAVYMISVFTLMVSPWLYLVWVIFVIAVCAYIIMKVWMKLA